MSEQNNYSCLINIISQYSAPLERLARILLVHKHRAADIVKWAMESIYEDEQFHEGPHLRALLIERTKELALGHNKAVALYQRIDPGQRDTMLSSLNSDQ